MSRIRKTWDNVFSGPYISNTRAMKFGRYLGGGGQRNNLTSGDISELWDTFERRVASGKPLLADTDSFNAAQAWLTSRNVSRSLTDEERAIVEHAERIELIDYTLHDSFNGRDVYRPRWKVVGTAGEFKYSVNRTRSDYLYGLTGEPINVYRR